MHAGQAALLLDLTTDSCRTESADAQGCSWRPVLIMTLVLAVISTAVVAAVTLHVSGAEGGECGGGGGFNRP